MVRKVERLPTAGPKEMDPSGEAVSKPFAATVKRIDTQQRQKARTSRRGRDGSVRRTAGWTETPAPLPPMLATNAPRKEGVISSKTARAKQIAAMRSHDRKKALKKATPEMRRMVEEIRSRSR